MPVDSTGKYQMNDQRSRAMDMGTTTAQPAQTAQPMSVTLTKNPDGTVSCDDGSGNPSVHPSLDEALSYAQEALGDGESEPDATGSTTATADDSGDM
jgi:hypothetical protein